MTTFWPGPLSKHPEHPSEALATTEKNTLDTATQHHAIWYGPVSNHTEHFSNMQKITQNTLATA